MTHLNSKAGGRKLTSATEEKVMVHHVYRRVRIKSTISNLKDAGNMKPTATITVRSVSLTLTPPDIGRNQRKIILANASSTFYNLQVHHMKSPHINHAHLYLQRNISHILIETQNVTSAGKEAI